MPAVCQTANTDLAAAFRCIGVPLKTDKGEDDRSRVAWRHWLMGTQSIPALSICEGIGVIQTSSLRRSLQDGALVAADPNHPLIDILASFQNWHALVAMCKTGEPHHIVTSPHGACLQPGAELSSITSSPAAFRTGDLKIAAAMVRLGAPITAITGTAPRCDIFIGDGLLLAPDFKINTAALARAVRADRLDEPATPEVRRVTMLINALEIRSLLTAYISRRTSRILMRKPGSQILRSSLIPENASNAILDAARKHLLGG